MAKRSKLSDFVNEKGFKAIEKAFYKNYKHPLEVTDTEGKIVNEFCFKECDNHFCKIVKSTRLGKKKCQHERVRSIKIAIETGQPYICVCHAGIVLVCVPIMEKDIPLGGIFFGKSIWEAPSEIVNEDILGKLKGVVGKKEELVRSIKELPIIPARKIFEMSDFLFVLFYELSGLDPQVIKWRSELSQQQSEIGELIQEQKQLPLTGSYPYQYERQLMEKVRIGDRTGTRDILNCMLATIMLNNPGAMDVLKARLLELISVLSRSAAEGGAEVQILLKKNLGYIQKLIEIETQPDLCAWAGKAVDEFIELVYETQDSKKITQIKPAVDFIKENFDQQIALADVAKSAHLSVSRLAHVFKDQMGITIIDFLTKIRIDKAKQLLMFTDKSCTEICFEVGYNNQSYFTRTFKDLTSMTPKLFRKSNQRQTNLIEFD